MEKRKKIKVIGIFLLLFAMLCWWGSKKEGFGYMMHSQFRQQFIQLHQQMTGLYFPNVSKCRDNENQKERELVKKELSILETVYLPVKKYQKEYGAKENTDVKAQEIPSTYLEDGGQEENSNMTQIEITKENTVEPPKEEKIEKPEKGNSKKNHTYSKKYTDQQLSSYKFLKKQFYSTDAMTPVYPSDLNGKKLLSKDLSIDVSSDKPKILIYHTHGSEAFQDSRKGKTEDTVIGMGDVLTRELEETYHIKVYHDRTVYDVIDGKLDRSRAYNVAGESVLKILKENPSIDVVIDLHRDGVADSTHLVTQIDGKKTAQIMFFNGMSRIKGKGEIAYLKNKNRSDNLAFSLQLQVAAMDEYDNYVRKIFLRSYRYNMHFKGRSLLIEAGAQTNTVEEEKNAMVPLAKILNTVLTKK